MSGTVRLSVYSIHDVSQEEELAKLKKRAEKFGVISKHLKTAEDKQAMAQENEKKRKRAEKFGTAGMVYSCCKGECA